MISVPAHVRAVLDRSFTYYVSAQSWLGDRLLADDIPVSAGGEETDRSLNVPERVTLTVPRRDRAVDWTPTADDSPLAANGQTLKISLGVGVGPAGVWWFQRGEFLIQKTELQEDGQSLTVTAVGLLALIDEAKFVAPFQATGTVSSTLRAMVEPAITLDLADAPADRVLTAASITFDNDRLASFYKLLDAWPADCRMNELGYLEINSAATPTTADVVRTFTTGAGGTVVTANGRSTREGAFNAILVTGYATDGTEVRGVRYVQTGPWAYPDGSANPLPVPVVFQHAAVPTQQIARAIAGIIMARKMREIRPAYTVTAIIDPTIQIGDPVLITTDTVTNLLCTVESISLPYFATGPMKLKVASV